MTVESLHSLFSSVGNIEECCRQCAFEDNYAFAKEHRWDTWVDRHVELYRSIVEHNGGMYAK